MSDAVEPMREVDRRKLNLVEALILAAILGMSGSILLLREAVTELKTTNVYMADEMGRLRTQLADVPALSQRVSRLEVRDEAQEDAIKELRQMRGLR